ncbi:HAD family hydrolase [Acutalibacter sp. 1XD8-33]|uniref:HAD family hydrolase n=1 Tax=Acutalibacter sp. 1XD8-33 TaxID=2320081 RepID=UPI000EA376B4|nr:HAD family hydrolase [Acutalibacter sp. 1XD8-33]RKJ38550.1 HAD family hydrolase [Acutalibacter sp. 1XD8-33]
MLCDGVLFDLDGTLWDSTGALVDTWRLALEGEPDIPHTPTKEELEGVMGMTAPQLMKTLFPHLGPDRAAELFEKCCQVENEYLRAHGGILYDGLEETLSALSARVPLGIVSNCNLEYIPCFLEAHGLEKYFTDWECIGRTGLEKWENIRLVAERCGMARPVYVGDTEMDRDAAQKAGVPFIHAAYGFGRFAAPLSIASPRELVGLLELGE